MLGPFVVNCVLLIQFLYSPLLSGWSIGGAYDAAREGQCVSACFGGVPFSSKIGVCEKVEFSVWLFPPVFVVLQFVNEFFRVCFHPLDFSEPLLVAP
jgi:hypothetical protein